MWKYKILFKRKWLIGFTYLFAIVMVVEFLFVSRTLYANKIIFDKEEQKWLNSADKVFEIPKKKFNRFVSYGLGGHDPYFWSNIVMSWYYCR